MTVPYEDAGDLPDGGLLPPAPHFLVVADEWDEDGGGVEVEHPPGCPTVQAFSGVDQFDCPVANEEYNSGLDMHFLHRDDPDNDWPHAERLAPGRYEIEVWSEKHPGGPWGPDEWSGGLRTVTPPQADRQPHPDVTAPSAPPSSEGSGRG